MGRGNDGVKHFTQARAGLCSVSVCPLLEDAAMWANTAYLMWPRQNGSLRGSWKAGSDVLEMGTSTHMEVGEPESQMGFPGGSVVKNLLANAGDPSSIPPGSGRSPGEGTGNPLQHPCLENHMERGVWWATGHGMAKSWTWVSDWTPPLSHMTEGKLNTAHSHIVQRDGVVDFPRLYCQRVGYFNTVTRWAHAVSDDTGLCVL